MARNLPLWQVVPHCWEGGAVEQQAAAAVATLSHGSDQHGTGLKQL